jgi:ferritin-like metal-binding protein YciE
MRLQDLLIEELQDLYDAEQQLLALLPQLADASRGEALRSAFTSHLEETRTHVSRLDDVFALMGIKAMRRRCAGMAGILEEGGRLLTQRDIEGAVLDAGLIAGAQKAEHYETLVEEEAADQTLSDLAVQEVNISASHEPT